MGRNRRSLRRQQPCHGSRVGPADQEAQPTMYVQSDAEGQCTARLADVLVQPSTLKSIFSTGPSSMLSISKHLKRCAPITRQKAICVCWERALKLVTC